MLAYIAIEAKIVQSSLQRMVMEVADVSFNRVTVDGDTSTNDSFVLIATGQANVAETSDIDLDHYGLVRDAIIQVAQQPPQTTARDGQGATQFITIPAVPTAHETEAPRRLPTARHPTRNPPGE